jgi:hypothetical protein
MSQRTKGFAVPVNKSKAAGRKRKNSVNQEASNEPKTKTARPRRIAPKPSPATAATAATAGLAPRPPHAPPRKEEWFSRAAHLGCSPVEAVYWDHKFPERQDPDAYLALVASIQYALIAKVFRLKKSILAGLHKNSALFRILNDAAVHLFNDGDAETIQNFDKDYKAVNKKLAGVDSSLDGDKGSDAQSSDSDEASECEDSEVEVEDEVYEDASGVIHIDEAESNPKPQVSDKSDDSDRSDQPERPRIPQIRKYIATLEIVEEASVGTLKLLVESGMNMLVDDAHRFACECRSRPSLQTDPRSDGLLTELEEMIEAYTTRAAKLHKSTIEILSKPVKVVKVPREVYTEDEPGNWQDISSNDTEGEGPVDGEEPVAEGEEPVDSKGNVITELLDDEGNIMNLIDDTHETQSPEATFLQASMRWSELAESGLAPENLLKVMGLPPRLPKPV